MERPLFVLETPELLYCMELAVLDEMRQVSEKQRPLLEDELQEIRGRIKRLPGHTRELQQNYLRHMLLSATDSNCGSCKYNAEALICSTQQGNDLSALLEGVPADEHRAIERLARYPRSLETGEAFYCTQNRTQDYEAEGIICPAYSAIREETQQRAEVLPLVRERLRELGGIPWRLTYD